MHHCDVATLQLVKFVHEGDKGGSGAQTVSPQLHNSHSALKQEQSFKTSFSDSACTADMLGDNYSSSSCYFLPLTFVLCIVLVFCCFVVLVC